MISRIKDAIGYIILVVAIALYIAYSVSRGFLLSTIEIAKYTSSFGDFCERIEYFGECNAAFIYAWLFSRIEYLSTIIPVITVLVVFFFSKTMYRTSLTSSLIVLLYATTPIVLFPSLIDQSGGFLIAMIAFMDILLITYGLELDKRNVLLIGLIVYLFLLLHPVTPLILLIYSALFLARYVNNTVNKTSEMVLAILSLPLMVVLLLLNPSNRELYVSSIILSSSSLVVDYFTRSGATGSSYRVITATILVLLSIVIGLITRVFSNSIVTIETYDPLIVYGVLGFLAVPGLVIALKDSTSRLERIIAMFTLLILPLSLLYSLSVMIVVGFMAIVTGVFLYRFEAVLLEGFYDLNKWLRILLGLLFIGLVVASSASSTIASSRVAPTYPLLSEIDNLIRSKGLEAHVNETLIERLENSIVEGITSTSHNRRILMVTDWDYSYWIQVILRRNNVDAYTLTHTSGSNESKILYAKLITSSWRTARYILSDISSDLGVNDIYVFIAFAHSSFVNDSYIGIPREEVIEFFGQQYPALLLEAFGDLDKTLLYLKLADRNISSYIIPVGRYGERVDAIQFTNKGLEMFITQLSIKALEESGNRAVHYYEGLFFKKPVKSEIQGFKLVYLENIPLGVISTRYHGVYYVYYTVALFKLET